MKQHEFIRQGSDAFQWFYREKYITHRDGNLALKLDNGNYFVSASGIDKTYMSIGDFLEVNNNSQLIWNDSLGGNEKPSIETQAHIDALNASGKQVSIHVHSPKTVALFELKGSYIPPKGWGNLPLYLLERELNTNWPELFRHTKVGKTIPFLDPGSKELHEAISESFIDKPDIIVLQRHGVLSVGNTVQEALEHIVRLEHISSILLDIEKAK